MKPQVANVQLMQKMNREKVLRYIRSHPGTVRPQVAAATGLSLSSITNITAFLLEKGLLRESGVEQVGRVGRKGVLLSFHPACWGLICAVLLPDSVRVCYTDLSGGILRERHATISSMRPEKVTEWLIHEIAALAEAADLPVLAVGIAVSGLVLDSRLVLSASLGWHRVDFKALLEPALGLPVFVENTTMVRAVWQFRAQESEERPNQLFIDLDGGVGAAQFYRGDVSTAMIGEIGHTTVAKDGDPCFCGNNGCLEVMCSADRMLCRYEKLAGRRVTLSELESRALSGDEAAAAVTAEGGEYLGIGLANLVNLLNPEAIYVNVGDFTEGGAVLRQAEETVRRRAYPAIAEQLRLTYGSLPDSGLIGGLAIHLCDRIFSADFPGGILE